MAVKTQQPASEAQARIAQIADAVEAMKTAQIEYEKAVKNLEDKRLALTKAEDAFKIASGAKRERKEKAQLAQKKAA